eukprot:2521146-Pyramimonas_sp.AAC.1
MAAHREGGGAPVRPATGPLERRVAGGSRPGSFAAGFRGRPSLFQGADSVGWVTLCSGRHRRLLRRGTVGHSAIAAQMRVLGASGY